MNLERLELIMDENKINTIQNLNILLVGVGGVGGSALEALVRFGIKNITVIDNDNFEKTNLNRQILSNINNIGNSKVKEAVLRAKSINPDVLINPIETFLNSSNIDILNNYQFDYIIDACDTITTKVLLIEYALKNNTKIITITGTGNRLHPELLTITKLNQTNYDPLAKNLRHLLKEKNLPLNIPCIWSSEIPIKSGTTVGSNVLVPNVAGYLAVSYIINDIK